MGKNVAFLILDQFADWEGAFLSSALLDDDLTSGNSVIWVSTDAKPKKSLGSLTVIPDRTVDEINDIDALDALVLIGGNSWRKPEAKLVTPLAKRFIESGKIVAFICDACYFAASEGFLNDHEHSGNDLEEMKSLAAYTNAAGFRFEDAVRDRQLITAAGNNPVPFMAEVLKALDAAPEADIDMWQDFYSIGFWNALRKYGYMTEAEA